MAEPQQLPLREIHLPDPISWWPPAPGWWGLTLLLLAILAGVWWWIRRRQRRAASALVLARGILLEIRGQYAEHRDHTRLVRELSALLRRVSISTSPRGEVAALTGGAWLEFLDRSLPERPFSSGVGRILIDAPYRPQVEIEDIDALCHLCEQWLNSVGQHGGGG